MKLFIGHFGDNKKENWFLCWADSIENAYDTIDTIGEAIFIEEIENQSGFICFGVKQQEEDGCRFHTLKTYEDGLMFDDYDWIEHIISQERSYPIEIDMRRIAQKNKEFLRTYKNDSGGEKN